MVIKTKGKDSCPQQAYHLCGETWQKERTTNFQCVKGSEKSC